jgi:hypothetical protein
VQPLIQPRQRNAAVVLIQRDKEFVKRHRRSHSHQLYCQNLILFTTRASVRQAKTHPSTLSARPYPVVL